MSKNKEDMYTRELCMLTGVGNQDRDYLYYLLIKDGSYFKADEPTPDVIRTENTVDDFESWFNNL